MSAVGAGALGRSRRVCGRRRGAGRLAVIAGGAAGVHGAAYLHGLLVGPLSAPERAARLGPHRGRPDTQALGVERFGHAPLLLATPGGGGGPRLRAEAGRGGVMPVGVARLGIGFVGWAALTHGLRFSCAGRAGA